MKKLVLALVLLLLSVKPVIAATEDALPVFCDDTKKVFEQLKSKRFSPIVMGSGINDAEVILRQYLLLRLGYTNLGAALLRAALSFFAAGEE